MTRRLFALSGCPFAHRVAMVLREKGLPFELVFYSPRARPSELDLVGPRAKSPTLFDGKDVVHDSLVVLEYLQERYPEPALMPETALGRARVRMAITRLAEELMPKYVAAELTALQEQPDARDLAAKIATFNEALAPWNAELERRPFVAGEGFTLADIVLYTPLPALAHSAEWQLPDGYPHLGAWFERVRTRPSSAPTRANSDTRSP